MKTIRLMIIDERMNATEIEINKLQFDSLGIDLSKVIKCKTKRELNNALTKFLENEK